MTKKTFSFKIIAPIIIIVLILPLFSKTSYADEPIDLILVEKNKMLMTVVVPIIATQKQTPVVLHVSKPINKNAVRLIRQLSPKRTLLLTTSSYHKKSFNQKMPVEIINLSSHAMHAAITLILKFQQISDKVLIADIDDSIAVIQGTALAAHMKIPFIPVDFQAKDLTVLTTALKKIQCRELIMISDHASKKQQDIKRLPGKVTIWNSVKLERQFVRTIKKSKIKNVILIGIPGDNGASWIAPYLSFMRKSPILVCRNPNAEQAQQQVYHFIDQYKLKPRSLTILADHEQIGVSLREFGEYQVNVEPCAAPTDDSAMSLGVGRIPFLLPETSFVVAGTLVREKIMTGRQKVLITGNPSSEFGDLPLAETITRVMGQEFKNFRMSVKEYYQKPAENDKMIKSLNNANFIFFQGHIVDQYLFPAPNFDFADDFEDDFEKKEKPAEPRNLRGLPLVVLQSCSSLENNVGNTIIESGGIGFIGSTTSVHSASGSSFMKAFCDGILYRGDTVGEALRDARNFYLCLAKLKQKRGHSETDKVHRVALTFRLWGDPELKLFHNLAKKSRWLPTTAEFTDKKNIRIRTPNNRLATTKTHAYHTRVFAYSHLAGLVKSSKKTPNSRRVMPLYFFRLPKPKKFSAKKYSGVKREKDDSERSVFMVDRYRKYIYILHFPKQKPQKGKKQNFLLKFQRIKKEKQDENKKK